MPHYYSLFFTRICRQYVDKTVSNVKICRQGSKLILKFLIHRVLRRKKSVDKVLSSTKSHLNEWITVKANVKEDFKKFHNLDLNQLDGLAIMSDTDNSKMSVVAFYQNIYFSAE